MTYKNKINPFKNNIAHRDAKAGSILNKTLRIVTLKNSKKLTKELIPYPFKSSSVFVQELLSMGGDSLNIHNFNLILFLEDLHKNLNVPLENNKAILGLLYNLLKAPAHFSGLEDTDLRRIRRKAATVLHALALCHSLNKLFILIDPEIYTLGQQINRVHSLLQVPYESTLFYKKNANKKEIKTEIELFEKNTISKIQRDTYRTLTLISSHWYRTVEGELQQIYGEKEYFSFKHYVSYLTLAGRKIFNENNEEFDDDFVLLRNLFESFDIINFTFKYSEFLCEDPINLGKIVGLMINLLNLFKVLYVIGILQDNTIFLKSLQELLPEFNSFASRFKYNDIKIMFKKKKITSKEYQNIVTILTNVYTGLIPVINTTLDISSCYNNLCENKGVRDLSSDTLAEIAILIKSRHKFKDSSIESILQVLQNNTILE